ncbi:Xaa-Pro dipeptidase [Hypericibacter adhaerens]|uniref:Xaa-Pro dipeptidase n=1 Tax=Hypericibacter adhaerens TaxID=2602016 RepID=A0A5J6MUZ8_9PROT|nr:Xaa-Pro peptidase family protein [Hypericibacter adhaerens]QEX21259.1 Xaa-Pro dipeptidase [Hypericibacter adhaerens]HVY50088.1 Xaa-Pro peptidase family protein [Devosia sp.]
MAEVPFAAFSETEHRARLARARTALGEAEFDGCIVIAPENLFYLAGYDSISSYVGPQALVFSAKGGGDPTLLVRDLDLPLVRETSWIKDVRTYHLNQDDVGALLAAIVQEKGPGKGNWGLEVNSYAVTAGYAKLLGDALPALRFKDVGPLLSRLQYIKSAAEIAYVREAAGYANVGVAAAREALRAGMKETALCAAVEGAVRRAGSDYPAIPTECASGSRSAGGHATAMPKIIGPNELVHLEFAGVARRYHSVSMLTMATGDPGPRARWLYGVALESLQKGLEACRPGASVVDIDNASLAPIIKAGIGHAAQMRFGVGIGIGYPPVWVGTFQIDRFSDGVLHPGMVFYVHAWLSLADERLGVMLGGSYLVGETAVEQLSGAGPVELFTA